MRPRPKMAETMDEIVGDYAYLAIAKDVDYPLNYPPKVAHDSSDEEVEEVFQWPVPFYLDAKWPIAFLDFHDIPGSPWPLATMAMGLGELVFMNVVLSCLMERAHESCQSILAFDKSLEEDLTARIQQKDWSGLVPVDLGGNTNKKIQDMLAFVPTPDIKTDIFGVLDIIAESFDKRTGLTDLMYGLNPGGKVSRSAADAQHKESAVNVRPEEMQRRAENWQTLVANLDRIAAGWHVKGSDLEPLLTPKEATLWDQLINTEPEIYVRQMRTTLEADSIKKPNKFRDNANLQQVIGYIMPVLTQQWQMTGDPSG